MTRKTFEESIDYAKNTNGKFVICTSVAVGRGINGVDYKTFSEHKEWDSCNSYPYYKKHEYTKILNVTDDHIIIEVDRKDERYNSGIFHHFIPLDNICMITIK